MTDHGDEREPGAGSKALRILGRIIQFPLTRIILALVAVGVALFVVSLALEAWGSGLPAAVRLWLSVVLAVAVAHLVYVGYVRLVERRPVLELTIDGAATELGLGALLGAGLMVASVAVLWLGGFYEVEAVRSPAVTAGILAASIQAGYIEEVMFRAIIFRITEEGLGSWWAVAISAALFGLAHIGNANATWLSSAAIMIEAGILLGAVYMLTQRLWAVVGVHFAWNYVQGGVFGISVSGHEVDGILQSRLSGPEWVTGGGFGIEASVVTVVICFAVAVGLLRVAIRRRHVVPPFWRRRPVQEEGSEGRVNAAQ